MVGRCRGWRRPKKAGAGCGQQAEVTSVTAISSLRPVRLSPPSFRFAALPPCPPLSSSQSLMDYRGDQRPPRSARPTSHPRSPAPPYPDPTAAPRPPLQQTDGSKTGVSFQHVEQGDRQAAVDSRHSRQMSSAYVPTLSSGIDPEHSDQFDPARVNRKKSLVRPDREKIDPSHRQWHYRSHVAQAEEEGNVRVGVMPSSKHLMRSSLLMTIL
jgi:hypothetical protein